MPFCYYLCAYTTFTYIIRMIDQLYILPILLFSVVVHEVAHGWIASRLGDPTARMLGRLTLNPIPHIDLVGSIMVPLFSLMAAGRVFIAWAKPVPVNPANFAHPRRDDMLVSVAGPLSNILVAVVCTIAAIIVGLVLGGIGGGEQESMATQAMVFLLKMFYGGVYLNIVLAVFNMIPLPPLDGSHVLAGFLPPKIARQYSQIGFLGVFVLIMLMRVPFIDSLFATIVNTLFSPFRTVMDTVLSL
jgi:Zn-dependent protease